MSQEALIDPGFLVKYEDFDDKAALRFVDESVNDDMALKSYEKKLQRIIGEDQQRLEIDLKPESEADRQHKTMLDSFKTSNQ